MKPISLLSRDSFRTEVFSRDSHRCVVCKASAVDAHHLIERRLWTDGGYYLANGVSLCSDCHMKAELTQVSVEHLRLCANITTILVPPILNPVLQYDKWGNEITLDGRRYPGPLFWEENVQKIISMANIFDIFVDRE